MNKNNITDKNQQRKHTIQLIFLIAALIGVFSVWCYIIPHRGPTLKEIQHDQAWRNKMDSVYKANSIIDSLKASGNSSNTFTAFIDIGSHSLSVEVK